MADSSITAMDITLQLAAAFGQGAGAIMMEADALRPAYEGYRDNIARAVSSWDDNALSTVSVMRAMGAYAAQLALADKRFVINHADVEAAMGIVTRSHAHPLGPCKLC